VNVIKEMIEKEMKKRVNVVNVMKVVNGEIVKKNSESS